MPDPIVWVLAAAAVLVLGYFVLARARKDDAGPAPTKETGEAARAEATPAEARDKPPRPGETDDVERAPGEGATPDAAASKEDAARDREAAVPLPQDKPSAPAQAEVARVEARRADRDRFREGLAKTRGGFVAKLARLFRGKPKVTGDLRDDVEEVLFTADIGTQTAQSLMDRVTEVLDRKEIAEADAVWSVIRDAARGILDVPAGPLNYEPTVAPYVLLMIGVNGVGKTTTLGKLASQHAAAGRKVLLVAGDTFRAAATEQLEVWARRVGCDLHAGADKADPSSVIFDGIARARREGHDVVLCDTAGRLHTKKDLMDELEKVRRAATKAIRKDRAEADIEGIEGPHDTWLVLDATIGQNALAQAKLFKESMDFTGLVVTKLDGTAKGGVVLGICDEMRIPIRFVGIGEGIDDLRPFDPEDFVDALLSDRDAERDEAGEAPG